MTNSPGRSSPGVTAILLFGSLAIGFLVVFPSLPGRMNIDAINIYKDSLFGGFSDWHVPFISWLWWKIGASPMLVATHTVLAASLIVGSAAFLLRQNPLPLHLALLLAALLALLPPVYAYITAVAKDSWVAALFVLMLALSVGRQTGISLPLRAVLLSLAAIIRPETMLLVPVFILAERFIFGRLLRPLIVYAVIVGGLLVAHNLFVYQVIKASRTNPEKVIFLFDLAGISIHSDTMLLPKAAFPTQDMKFLKDNFISYDVEGILWKPPVAKRPVLVDGEALQELRRAWFKAIFTHPLAYLKVRLGVTLQYLHGSSFFHNRIDRNEHISMFFPALNQMANGYLLFSRNLFGSHALPFFGSLLVLGFLWPRRENRDHRPWIAYLAVSIIYHMEFMMLSVSPGFRYGFASVVLFYLIGLLVLVRYWPALRMRFSKSRSTE